jgi:hypothetical protein
MSIRFATSALLWPTSWAPSRRPDLLSPVYSDRQLVRARVIGFVVPSSRLDRDWTEAAIFDLLGIAKTGSGHGQVEHLHHLSAERALKLCVASDGVLTCHATLLVGGCAERKVGWALP